MPTSNERFQTQLAFGCGEYTPLTGMRKSKQSPRGQRRRKKTGHGRIPETGHDRILQRPIDSIRPSPENQKLYRSVDPGDPDRELKELPRDLGQRGLLEPIVANAQLDAEKQDAVFLEAKRRQVHESLTDVFAGDDDDED